MAGPTGQRLVSLYIPFGESQVQYALSNLGREILNFDATSDQTLRSASGFTIYEPPPAQEPAYRSETIHSVFHTRLFGGLTDMLLVRWGDALYWHNGWSQSYEKLTVSESTAVPLSDELRTTYPDQYVVLNDRIIFTNGVDRARIITYEGMSFPLGFSSPTPSPQALSPTPIPTVDQGVGFSAVSSKPLDQSKNGSRTLARYQQETNYRGYSWPGRIGTIGDVLDGVTGSVLSGAWFYYIQLEDFFGNLSALSGASNPARLGTSNAGPPALKGQVKIGWFARIVKNSTGSASEFINGPDSDNTEVDDLLKQFVVSVTDRLPHNTAAIRIYRTPDTKREGAEPRLLTRIASAGVRHYPDNLPDQYLGDVALRTIKVPIFRTMCTHQGRLVIGNTQGDPGIVRRSEPGAPGTFVQSEYVIPDAGGAEITAVTSHAGRLLAFTEDTVYSLQEFSAPIPLSQGIGCVAPRSIVAMPDGQLIWMGRDGFYGLRPNGPVEALSTVIERTIHHYLNQGRKRMAVATYSYEALEYQCAVAEAGSSENNLLLCYGQGGWRRKKLGMAVRDMCTTRDWRKYTLIAAKELPTATRGGVVVSSPETTNDVYVLDRETVAYTPPDRTIRYRSNWLRPEQNGLTPAAIRTMYVGMLDSFDGTVTVRFYENGSWAEAVSMSDLKTVGTDSGQGIVTDVAGKAVIGTARTRDPRLFWRQVPVKLNDARLWAFEIETSASDGAIHLAAVGFDVSIATMGNPNSRVPRRSDV